MDLGLASAPDNKEDSSMDGSGGSRERSVSPNNFEGQSNVGHQNGMNINGSFRKDVVPYFEQGKLQIARDQESPEQSSQGWVPNKAPKLQSSSSNSEQAQEATMRKARVSVRARSEAPMVQRPIYNFFCP